MPSKSTKLVCPVCFQIARSTDPYPALMCARCKMLMKVAPPRVSAALDDPSAVVQVNSFGSPLDRTIKTLENICNSFDD